MEKLKKFFGADPYDNIIIRLISALCLSATVLLFVVKFDFTEMANYANVGLVSVAASLGVCFMLLTLIAFKRRKKNVNTDKNILLVTLGVYAVFTVTTAQNYYYTLGLCAAYAVLVYYYTQKGYFGETEISAKKLKIGIIVSAAAIALIMAAYLLGRYSANQCPNYDFGIFCQMFHNLRSHFQPLTTVERDTLLSHFSVHMSLIYYIVLPIYAVFPSPVTLQLMQVFALASAAAPVYFLCKKYGLSNLKTLLFEISVLFHPALFGGGAYDFHENCFLVPLLLWVFYFFEKEKYIPMAVFSLLVCTVKEDAPVYLIFLALWIFIARNKKRTAIILGAGATAYFIGVLAIMTVYGNGIMSGRYSNFLCAEGDGLFSMIKNIAANPGFVFTQLFISKEGTYAEKVLFILQMLTPFASLPLCVKKVSNLILMFPMLLINLMSVYVYQYDIGYQYVYGPLCFLVYLAIINASETDDKKCLMALRIAAVSSVALLASFYFPKTLATVDRCVSLSADTKIVNEYLDAIPDDASICCSTMLIPRLSKHEVLYEDFYHEPAEGEVLDYIISDGRYDKQKFIDKYIGLGYEITETVKGENGNTLLTVLQMPE